MVGVSEMLEAQGRVDNSIKHLSRFGYGEQGFKPARRAARGYPNELKFLAAQVTTVHQNAVGVHSRTVGKDER
jgi:hypothetical protein